MKRNMSVLLSIVLFVSCLTGCGGEHGTPSHGNTEGISGAAVSVSGQAVSGSAVTVDKEDCSTSEETFCYHTDTNLYLEKMEGVAQFRLDGTHKKRIKIQDFDELICIAENYMYYKTIQEDEERNVISCQICRAPIEKDGEGYDIINLEQTEVLVSDCMEIWGIYADSQYIFYQRGDTGVLGKYDVENHRELSVDHVPIQEQGDYVELMRCGDRMIATSGKGVFIHDMDGTEWKKISDTDPYLKIRSWNDEAFFYYDYDDIRKCEYVNQEARVFISGKQLRQAVRKAEGLDPEVDTIDVCYVTDLFCQGERLYLQVQLNFKRGDVYHMKYLLFSQGREETELCYEKALTECMRSYGKNKKGKWKNWERTEKEPRVWVAEENVLWNAAKCYRMIYGKAFYCIFDKKKEKWRVGCCELSTGTFRWLTKEDKEYYEPCYAAPDRAYRDRGDIYGNYRPEKAWGYTHVDLGADGVTDKRGYFDEDKN